MEASIGEAIKPIRSIWWLLALFGLISLGVGIYFVASPHETLSTFAVIAGIVLVIDGALAVLASIFGKGDGRGLLATIGVLSLIAGLVLIKHPFTALTVFVLIVGIWLIAAGVVRLIVAIGDKEGRGGNLILSAIDLIAGIAIFSWPNLSLSTLAVIIGIVLIIRGIADIYVGFALRSAFKEIESSGV